MGRNRARFRKLGGLPSGELCNHIVHHLRSDLPVDSKLIAHRFHRNLCGHEHRKRRDMTIRQSRALTIEHAIDEVGRDGVDDELYRRCERSRPHRRSRTAKNLCQRFCRFDNFGNVIVVDRRTERINAQCRRHTEIEFSNNRVSRSGQISCGETTVHLLRSCYRKRREWIHIGDELVPRRSHRA